jgi:hypothetical protein
MEKMTHLLIVLAASTLALSCGGVVTGDDDDSDTSDVVPDETADGTGDPAGDSPDDPDEDAPADVVPDGTPPDECVLVIVEAESFETNEYWAECPGTGCEDDRSGTASGGGHLITYEDHYTGDPAGAIQTDVTLPRTGTWYVWARSVRAGGGREWQFGFNGTASSSIGSGEPVWELGGSFDTEDTSAMLAIRDVAPDPYWAYPDAIIMSIVDTFDPNLCAGDGFEASHCLCD